MIDNIKNTYLAQIIGSDNGLVPKRQQAIIWTNGDNQHVNLKWEIRQVNIMPTSTCRCLPTCSVGVTECV